MSRPETFGMAVSVLTLTIFDFLRLFFGLLKSAVMVR